jgi:hypothetical protein
MQDIKNELPKKSRAQQPLPQKSIQTPITTSNTDNLQQPKTESTTHLNSPNQAREQVKKTLGNIENITECTTKIIPNKINQDFAKVIHQLPTYPKKITINSHQDSQNIGFSNKEQNTAVMSAGNGDFPLGGYRLVKVQNEEQIFHGSQEESLAYTTCISAFLEEPYGNYLDKIAVGDNRYPNGRYRYKDSLWHGPGQLNALYTQNVPCFALADNVKDTANHFYRVIDSPFNFNIFTIAGFDLRNYGLRKEQRLFMKDGQFDWQDFKNGTKAKYDLFFKVALLNGNTVSVPAALSCLSFAMPGQEAKTKAVVAEAFAESALTFARYFQEINMPILNGEMAKMFEITLQSVSEKQAATIKNMKDFFKNTQKFNAEPEIILLPEGTMQIAFNNLDAEELALLKTMPLYIPGIAQLNEKTLIVPNSQVQTLENYLRILNPNKGITSIIAAEIMNQLPVDQKRIPLVQRINANHELVIIIDGKPQTYVGCANIVKYLQSLGLNQVCINQFYMINTTLLEISPSYKASDNLLSEEDLLPIEFIAHTSYENSLSMLAMLENLGKEYMTKINQESASSSFLTQFFNSKIDIAKKNIGSLQKEYCFIVGLMASNCPEKLEDIKKLAQISLLMNYNFKGSSNPAVSLLDTKTVNPPKSIVQTDVSFK